MEKRRFHADYSSDGNEKLQRSSSETIINGNQCHLDQEKRVRREIANSNERRRMQSINAGFDSLRILLPPIPDGEKMSKATILQLTAKYINTLLMRVNLLENEVAVYRQSAGIQAHPILPELPTTFSLPRKRKSDDLRKRSDGARSRKRRTEAESNFESSRVNYVHCSPDSADIHQTSPSNSFNASTTVSPTSPQPESTSSTAARLEHLVMAIEQIEGGVLNVSPQTESNDGSFSVGDQSPPETYWHSPQEQFHGYTFAETQGSNHDPNIKAFNDVFILNSVSDIGTPLNVASTTENSVVQATSEEYPIVAKLLNRPIPHKYLHRPQVVVNSSH